MPASTLFEDALYTCKTLDELEVALRHAPSDAGIFYVGDIERRAMELKVAELASYGFLNVLRPDDEDDEDEVEEAYRFDCASGVHAWGLHGSSEGSGPGWRCSICQEEG